MLDACCSESILILRERYISGKVRQREKLMTTCNGKGNNGMCWKLLVGAKGSLFLSHLDWISNEDIKLK